MKRKVLTLLAAGLLTVSLVAAPASARSMTANHFCQHHKMFCLELMMR